MQYTFLGKEVLYEYQKNKTLGIVNKFEVVEHLHLKAIVSNYENIDKVSHSITERYLIIKIFSTHCP